MHFYLVVFLIKSSFLLDMLCYNTPMKITKCCNKNDQRTLGILKRNSKGLTAYGILKELQKYKKVNRVLVV